MYVYVYGGFESQNRYSAATATPVPPEHQKYGGTTGPAS